MRVERLYVKSFRNLRNIEIDVPRSARVVCIVGENGSGKTNILELIGAVATRAGLVQAQIEYGRGVPLQEPHDLEARVYIDEEIRHLVGSAELATSDYQSWDGTLTVLSTQSTTSVFAGGLPDASATSYGERMVQWLRGHGSTYFLWNEAERTFPATASTDISLGEALRTDSTAPQQRKAVSIGRSSTKYSAWLQHIVANYTNRAVREYGRALNSPDKVLHAVDPFERYADSLRAVLPHLSYVGLDEGTRLPSFSNGTINLRFDQLSGGEREIAFMVGLLDWYNLERGLVLIDEPEIHLNPSLVRRWTAFLSSFSTSGQTWLATHSLECIEAAGFEHTFLLRKDLQTSQSEAIERLSEYPEQQVLTGLLGFPAFSLSRQVFVFVEGERTGEERERFDKLIADSEYLFVEAGGCSEVKRIVRSLADIAADVHHDLRLHGVLDWDERSEAELAEFRADARYTVLDCFEIENIFLEPSTIEAVGKTLGRQVDAVPLVREASDRFAGAWVLDRALLHVVKRPDDVRAVRQQLKGLNWSQVEAIEAQVLLN